MSVGVVCVWGLCDQDGLVTHVEVGESYSVQSEPGYCGVDYVGLVKCGVHGMHACVHTFVHLGM